VIFKISIECFFDHEEVGQRVVHHMDPDRLSGKLSLSGLPVILGESNIGHQACGQRKKYK
jgi:hypothetical protein